MQAESVVKIGRWVVGETIPEKKRGRRWFAVPVVDRGGRASGSGARVRGCTTIKLERPTTIQPRLNHGTTKLGGLGARRGRRGNRNEMGGAPEAPRLEPTTQAQRVRAACTPAMIPMPSRSSNCGKGIVPGPRSLSANERVGVGVGEAIQPSGTRTQGQQRNPQPQARDIPMDEREIPSPRRRPPILNTNTRDEGAEPAGRTTIGGAFGALNRAGSRANALRPIGRTRITQLIRRLSEEQERDESCFGCAMQLVYVNVRKRREAPEVGELTSSGKSIQGVGSAARRHRASHGTAGSASGTETNAKVPCSRCQERAQPIGLVVRAPLRRAGPRAARIWWAVVASTQTARWMLQFFPARSDSFASE
ncbi:hypothetical protein FB451DRAFT_1174945 [Mycena latifolia]|nr:hypothetical protein FB451DRAFT_1174945 [Mycena latifolia]